LGLEGVEPLAPTFKPQTEGGEKTLRYRVVPTRVHPVQNGAIYFGSCYNSPGGTGPKHTRGTKYARI